METTRDPRWQEGQNTRRDDGQGNRVRQEKERKKVQA